jgi:hypothetical protein
MRLQLKILLIAFAFNLQNIAEAKSKNKSKKPEKVTEDKPIPEVTEDNTMVKSSTKIDFSETAIDGQMKAPQGFFLQGHSANSMSQLVKLRSNFRSELRNSRSAVKSHVR